MKRKFVFYTELAYAVGLLTLALGAALMERADFGMSMVVAPAYLLHLKISQSLPFFTFGMSEYVFQALLLLVMVLVLRRFKPAALLSFVTAVIYGLTLDLVIRLLAPVPVESLAGRIACYIAGVLVCAFGVSCLFHTYLPPEAYELFVKELAGKYGWEIHRVKTVYDLCSCLLGLILSFAFFGFGRFEGVKWGTILCAAVNGFLIGRCSRLLEKGCEFRDALPWRGFFQR